MLVLKIMFLFLALSYGFCCVGRLIKNQAISSFQIGLMAIGITGFITIQWLL